MGLRDIGERLPPGFRFFPSDEELICHYLHKKILNEESLKGTLVDIDLHTCEPWQLPQVAKLNNSEWYFFSFRDRKYATGLRANRATTSGYWKATGKDRLILDPNTKKIAGKRKTLVFYRNRAPNGIKSGWIMHEFRLENPHFPSKEDWVLCRVFYKGKSDEDSENNNNNNNNNKYQDMFDCSTTIISTHLVTSSSNLSFSQNNSLIIDDNNDIMDIIIDQNYDGPMTNLDNNNDNNNNNNNNNININNLSSDPNNFLQILKDTNVDNGFMWDIDFEEHSIFQDN